MSFKAFLLELMDSSFRRRVAAKNPSDSEVEAMLDNSQFKELRYLMFPRDNGTIWLWPAERMTHHEFASYLGVPDKLWFTAVQSGYVTKGNIAKIKESGFRKFVNRGEPVNERVDSIFRADDQVLVHDPSLERTIAMINNAKYFELRYLMHPIHYDPSLKTDIWVVDSHQMQHGHMANYNGISDKEWYDNSLTGYIHKEDIENLRHAKNLKQWIIDRHKKRLTNYIEAEDYKDTEASGEKLYK